MGRSAVILIFNAAEHILLQKRSEGDASYPGHWDFSAAGGIEPEETPLQGAKRELSEEIGI